MLKKFKPQADGFLGGMIKTALTDPTIKIDSMDFQFFYLLYASKGQNKIAQGNALDKKNNVRANPERVT